ncbi:MAG: cytochrome c [Gammaproteobacteria bacterium]
MRFAFVPVILVSVMATGAFAADKPNDVARGKQLYFATGCDQCHGTQGKGGAGPRLAPGPIPYEGMVIQLRKPRVRMPLYSAVVMPDGDVAAIFAYLQSVPKGKTASEIPMLKALSY